jgi:hypothetical protein
MPTESIPIGKSTALLQNVQYALPPKLVFITSSVAVESSIDGTVWTAATGANTTGIMIGALFVRCPTANAVVVCKAY